MKGAFSLLELAFVIVILGVVLGVAKFYFVADKNLALAAKQIQNDLAYTRNLALMQAAFRAFDTSVAKDEWFKARWQVYFIRSKSATNDEQTYTIFLDKNGDGNANLGKNELNLDKEIAVDILNAKKLMNSGQSGVISKDDERANARFNIEKKFGVKVAEFKGACAGATRVIFDEFGRLYSPLKNANAPYEKLLLHKNAPCVIRLKNAQEQSICIVLDTLSGYAFVPKTQNANSQRLEFNGQSVECGEI